MTTPKPLAFATATAFWVWAIVGLSACASYYDHPMSGIRERIEAGDPSNVHALLVARGGERVAEWYFEGPDERRGTSLGTIEFEPDTLHDIRSVTKSIVALLFGFAVSDGAIETLDTPVLDYFPEYTDLVSEERRRITLHHLLSMTSGWRWDESTYPYTDLRNSETAMDHADDRLRYVLSQPIDAEPGTQFRYSGGDVALIAEVIERVVGEPIEEYARRRLFEPLGITESEWLKDKKGVPLAASGLRMRPRDMLKIGQLMLDSGRYQGREILPPDWATTTVTAHAVVASAPECGMNYGYYWWLWPACPQTGEPAKHMANGNGGQHIVVVPDYDLVVVTTAGLYNDPRQGEIDEVLESVIAWVAQQQR
ncbi:MAG: serine hydrolase domain-containing protein [Hyphomonas sp.]